MLKDSNLEFNKNVKDNDEVDIQNFPKFLFRNKRFISLCSVVSLISTGFFALSQKRIWEGQFQIVLNTNQVQNINSTNPFLNSFINKNQINNLQTQVGILRSPSVLLPIYEFVKEKNKLDFKSNKFSFQKWKKNLLVELENGTSILNIAYRDTDKSTILPVLEKMSLIYQDYSLIKKQKQQKLLSNYLFDQVKKFKIKSSNSFKLAQNYAIDQDLIFLEKSIPSNDNSNIFLPNIRIENIRVEAANEIRLINLQLKKIRNLSNDAEELQYIGTTIPEISKQGLPQALNEIEEELLKSRKIYTDNDKNIKRLLEKRELAINLLKNKAINYLEAYLVDAEARMEAAMRPKEVLLQYKELIRKAGRDESTLINLENQLRVIELEQAKSEDPWELITNPTILANPVGISRRIIVIYGAIIGFLLGNFISFIKENRLGKVFDLKVLEQRLATSVLAIISKEEDIKVSKQIIFLKDFLLNQSASKICFISMQEENDKYLEIIIEFLIKKYNFDKNITLVSSQQSLKDCLDSDIKLLFSSSESIYLNEINSLRKRFYILNIDLDGIFIFK